MDLRSLRSRGWQSSFIWSVFGRSPQVNSKLYRVESGGGRPVQGGIKGCWAPDAGQARTTMHRLWPNDSMRAGARGCLPLPRYFGQLAQPVTEDMVSAPCGPDPEPCIKAIRAHQEAGIGEIYPGRSAAGSMAPSISLPVQVGEPDFSRCGVLR